jgi:hypothetical protein
METNATPTYEMGDNVTGCCPRFKPEGWDSRDLHFKNKPFVRATTRSLFHIPINMAQVYKRTSDAIEAAHAYDYRQILILSRDLSPWSSEHLFAVDHDVPGEEMARLTGDYRTKVFEGPFKDAPKWESELEAIAAKNHEAVEKTYFFYTTCPKCAKIYGKNYVVGVAKVAA